MAASSNTAGQPKYGPRNAFDGLRIALPAPAVSGQYPIVSAFDGLRIAASTPASTSAASSSGTKHLPYDVFINHHGGDTKHTVANSIYNSLHANGLRVFLDKNELQLGDFFPRALEEAMRSASLHIAIFSEHYAQSPWCLAELYFMVKTGTKIIPVFYHVEPSTLRWAIQGKGIYADSFSKYEMKSSNIVSHVFKRVQQNVSFWIGNITNSEEHEKKRRYSSEQLQHWKRALHEASFFTGDIINNQDDEPRVVKNVVTRVMKELNKLPFEVAKHPVGVDQAVENFNTVAAQSGGSIQIVGIWGMGGSGKTTLAKKIFNDRRLAMDRSSFLFDLRDAAGKGLPVEKQKRLLEDLNVEGVSFDNVDAGKRILESRLRSVPVLIILDDVDHTDQLDALLPARERLGHGSLIVVTTRELGVLKAWGISTIYQMKPLNATHAKQLFCWHAFLQPHPLSGFEDLVEKFLNACNCLPLSLKVVGAQLYGNFRKDYWQSLLDKLSRILPDDIKLRLQVSYDALDHEEKEMFLDTACFFIGQRKSVAIEVWEGSGWSGLHGWERLFNKCLVEEVEDGDRIRMHDHLRDLAREVAKRQSPYRLWSPQQSIEIHSQQEATRIRGLANAIGDSCYPRQGNIIVQTSLGERDFALCSLGLKIFVGNGDFINQEHSQISRELVWLQCHKFEHKNLPPWLSLKKLRILELFSPQSLEGLWECDADAPLQLRELVIERCNSLREFPRSIGHLKNLKKILIDSSNWDTLTALPQEFCHLQSLEHLEIQGCRNLLSLPSNFGELTNLQRLNLNGCTALKMLPDSFKKLTLLEHLNLDGCIEIIIKSELHVLENMAKLRYLNFNGCRKLDELRLPEMASLTKLYLGETSLKAPPATMFQLTKLTELVIGSGFLQTLPSSLENLSSLTRLTIRGCKKLEALPDSLEHLNCLTDLVINDSGVKCLPKSFIHLQSLEIRDTPVSELSFGLGCMLKTIILWETKVSKISISGDSCPFLETFRLYYNKDLRDLETLPATLKTIQVYYCDVLKDIRGLRGLKNLQKLEIVYCKELDGLPFFAELTSLEMFTLEGSSKVKKIAGLQELRSLRVLEIELELLPSLAELTSLKTFTLQECKKMEVIETLKCLKSLEELAISDCPELEVLASLEELISLKSFDLSMCHNLEKIEGLQRLRSLETLKISDCSELDRLPSLEELIFLEEIQLEKCHKLKKIEGLQGLRSLETLNISDCPELDRLPSLEGLIFLKEIQLGKCHKLKKIEGLQGLRALKTLNISDCPELDRLPSLEELISLKNFTLRMCHKLEKVEGLQGLRSMETLHTSDCSELDMFLSISEITSLKEIKLEKCHKLEKIDGLQGLRALETLNISDCPELNRLPSLEELTSLKEFYLRGCHKLEKIDGLESLRSLVKLEVHSRWNLPCIVKLEHCERLERVVVVTNERSDVEPFMRNIQKWPRDVIICTRDVGSLKSFFEKLPYVSVLDYSEVVEVGSRLVLRRPESSANANAILICFIIDCVYPYLDTHIEESSYQHNFHAELGEGKWVWMGVFTQGSRWFESKGELIYGYSDSEDKSSVIVKVEEAWLVMGEESSIVRAFYQLFQKGNEC